MTLRSLFTTYSEKLQPIYGKQEAESLVFWLFEAFFNKGKMDVLKDEALGEIPENLQSAFSQLLEKKPIQYVLGEAPFYGRAFKVNASVLIPRNETEELVHLIIKENKKLNLRILDIGTGSGCIPISLALEIPSSKIFALDISKEALDVAKENAKKHEAPVAFFQVDILNEDIPVKDLDIIVSNPPYVCESEKALMHENVLNFEPHLALFVKDNDPLIFYKIIAKKAKSVLRSSGKLYFEINEALGERVQNLLKEQGYKEIMILKDLNNRDRIVKAKL
ncbi:peptide chain release factor N(5)-glutamine methyltransferase [Belliella aquatica]|uniref:Release factor glutamine methyltransferase n=1 Tax=Belliella aquatica TaxID=1323734 RepID=A0ABQ1N2M7_9BACT|nr:peptide chain release factor N(5)-glutamine methyltransferase [Belliella aquatica]MCH7404022.1 peptide chain release factor N(5)-glutamine methyltransferase [Belliella aquatica]GGC49802.1 release factor glutamine methyltransferase [Belliella aquatica]